MKCGTVPSRRLYWDPRGQESSPEWEIGIISWKPLRSYITRIWRIVLGVLDGIEGLDLESWPLELGDDICIDLARDFGGDFRHTDGFQKTFLFLLTLPRYIYF